MNSNECKHTLATRSWCKQLPKAELHAHLSGSLRAEAIRKLINKTGNEDIKRRAEGLLDARTGRTLKQCFELFPIIHELITDLQTLHDLVIQVLEDFDKENTVYLELRTTPRASRFFSAESYLGTVLKAVHDYHEQNPNGLVCHVLVSLSRHLPVEEARQAVKISEDLMASTKGTGLADLIVGFELSGNPSKGQWKDFEPILNDVRARLRLPISLHFGEVDNEEEAMAMLDFKPDRIGHAIIMSKAVTERLVSERDIGIEVCITSNLVTKSVSSIAKHPVVQTFIPNSNRFCLCTDDCGVFDTTLSDEYGRLVEHLPLTREQVAKMAFDGLELWFCRNGHIKQYVYERFFTKLQQSCLREDGLECDIDRRIRAKSVAVPQSQSKNGA